MTMMMYRMFIITGMNKVKKETAAAVSFSLKTDMMQDTIFCSFLRENTKLFYGLDDILYVAIRMSIDILVNHGWAVFTECYV